MKGNNRPPGKTTVSPDVLIAIARMATLNVAGVSGMAAVSGGVNRFFARGLNDGIQIKINENTVTADIYVVVAVDVNIREVGRNVQQQVTRAIQEMVGLNVVQIDIHIEDIDYEATEV
jgi:uncharacterized alkaline shock family protein YloU